LQEDSPSDDQQVTRRALQRVRTDLGRAGQPRVDVKFTEFDDRESVDMVQCRRVPEIKEPCGHSAEPIHTVETFPSTSSTA
jgi:hypothetical protein